MPQASGPGYPHSIPFAAGPPSHFLGRSERPDYSSRTMGPDRRQNTRRFLDRSGPDRPPKAPAEAWFDSENLRFGHSSSDLRAAGMCTPVRRGDQASIGDRGIGEDFLRGRPAVTSVRRILELLRPQLFGRRDDFLGRARSFMPFARRRSKGAPSAEHGRRARRSYCQACEDHCNL